MPQIGQREFAHAKEPVRMPCPFDIQIIVKPEREAGLFAHQFIHNSPVVDAINANASPGIFVEQPASFFLNVRDGYGFYAEQLLCEHKVRQRFLAQRIDFHQNHVLRIVISYNCPLQKGFITLRVQSAQQIFEIPIEPKDLQIGLRERCLVCVQGREALQLHQLRLQVSV